LRFQKKISLTFFEVIFFLGKKAFSKKGSSPIHAPIFWQKSFSKNISSPLFAANNVHYLQLSVSNGKEIIKFSKKSLDH